MPKVTVDIILDAFYIADQNGTPLTSIDQLLLSREIATRQRDHLEKKNGVEAGTYLIVSRICTIKAETY